RGAGDAALAITGGGEPEGPLPVDSQEQPEKIEPQILAEIELKTDAHINKVYRPPPRSAKTGFLVGAGVVALGITATFYWLSRSRSDSSIVGTLFCSHNR